MDNKKIGKFICELRKEKKLTQYDLAEKIPIGREAVSKWERGINKPDKSCIQALCKIFDVTSDEILLGKRKAEKEDIQNLTLELYEDRNKKQRLAKLFIIIIILISFLFLIYYFIENYNSIHVHTINYSDNNLTITDGIFTTTKEKIYFYLGKVDSEKTINKVKLYYKDKNNSEKIICETDDTNIMLYDYYGYNNYFDFKDMKYILKNTYLEYEIEENKYTIKIDFVKDFNNNRIFNKKENNISNDNYTDNKINIAKLKEKLILENDLYTYSNSELYITYDENTNLLNLIIVNNKVNKEWNYYIDLDMLSYNEYNNKKIINSFTSKNENIDCITGICDNSKEVVDYFFNEISKLY